MNPQIPKLLIRTLKIALLVLIGALITRYQWHLLSYLEWYDEVEHIVGSKLIVAGSKLYESIHALHGPLIYFSGVLLENIGNYGVRGHRIPIAILQWLALLSIYFSPINSPRSVKLAYVLAVATVMLIYLPDLFGHTYIFQVVAGLFLIIILTQYTLPTLINPSSLNRPRIFTGNFLIACLPFLALTYIPLSLALFICSIRKQYFKTALSGFLLSISLNVIFLAIIGSISGYFILHFWVNLHYARPFVEGEALGIKYFANAALNAISADLLRFTIFILICSGIYRLAMLEKKFPWRASLLGIGIASLLTRSMGFQGLPLLYLALTFPLVFFSWNTNARHNKSWYLRLLLLPLIALCMLKLFLLNPAKISDRQIRTTSEFSNLAQLLTNKEDRILAWSWKQYEYLLADRLPASGNFFYLPWQNEYYKHPLYDIKIDSCRDIEINKPKIMFIDEATYGGAFWKDYAPICVSNILQNQYIRLDKTNYYLRKDIYPIYQKLLQSSKEK